MLDTSSVYLEKCCRTKVEVDYLDFTRACFQVRFLELLFPSVVDSRSVYRVRTLRA